MNTDQSKKSKTGLKRTILEWMGIGAVLIVLYATGLHTEVIGTMQRALLWTGLLDAETQTVNTTDGPLLSEATYNLPLTNSDGEELRLQHFKGKVLFINIWASWCPPCVAEMPTIESLYTAVQDHKNIAFLLISVDEDQSKATAFMEGKEFPMPYYFPDAGLPSIFQSPYIPATYVISKGGKLVYKKEGIADYSSASFRNWMIQLSEREI
ncbi:TlpA family protein disulfide reductase [Fodinibius salsisoli]|uniref:TlpA family protein disulfide reductase n=1 Tax=Fodinibius salsisoli TaxID=2820877 RepID=A0ABT3PS41_9BACT|nr:TlpA disulfide reductase family protein [Fodinibius salsisoli]MCW9708687.1 TlpA family protein disulfide reductase [Fodinibius salsisoli]